MRKTTTKRNLSPSPNNARQIEIENEAQRLLLHRKELELTEKRLKSWRTDNDTFNALLKMLTWPVSIAVFLLVGNFIYKSNEPAILSMGSGCEIPATLAVELDIPAMPYLDEEPTVEDAILMDKLDKKQLIAAIIRRDNDRAEIRRICRI